MGRGDILEFLKNNPDKFFSQGELNEHITATSRCLFQLRKFNEVNYIYTHHKTRRSMYLYKYRDKDCSFFFERK